ncbi:hypothetical protein HVZ88_25420 (plasmid) [Escherichia coli]|nr:hypothetical protein HVZ88_25420 [Escherichia coli]
MKGKFKAMVLAVAMALGVGGAEAESSFQCDRLEVTAENLLILKTKIKDIGEYMIIVEDRALEESNEREVKTVLGLGVFMAKADVRNELATALVKVTTVCESLGYEKTERLFHGFADDYLDALEEGK